jgi:cytochrome c-type biogenesis protein
MLPVYVSYFFAGDDAETNKKKALINVLGFVFGFTILFVLLGLFAGTIGGLLLEFGTVINIICGLIVILLGLNFMGFINIPFLNLGTRLKSKKGRTVLTGFFPSVMFGFVFAVSWSPCITAFLGAALMKAAQSGESFTGMLLLLCFSMGLALPFVICAMLIDRFKSAFDFIKKHYKTVNMISGGLLIIMGILIATGWVGYLYRILLTTNAKAFVVS